ncbi:hypothetical protein Zmor_021784 [Zophobas morio]|uniref:Uncharacterized protein n=1 Tax=Zophobas morio TaxID=2755281 RepID=A0AA38MBG6_9CUCU|nr:hypothetical protein Zmor_021784 [Zophobas morio]
MVLKLDVSTVKLSPVEIYQTIELSMPLFGVFEKMEDFVQTLNAESEILNVVEENPGISVRKKLAYPVGISPFVVWRTLNEQSLHPYHVQRVQH